MSSLRADLKVRDLMQTEVVTVNQGTTVAQLMRVLWEHSVSGVPVVDRNKSVVGVVSVSDVMALAEWPDVTATDAWSVGGEQEKGQGAEEGAGYFATPDGPLWHFPLARLPLMKRRLETTPVEEIMTPATFHVRPEATLKELAQFLVRSDVHRALVLEGSRLAGIVTSMDVVRAVADGASS